MKNTTIMKLVIGLGLITSTIFMSCSKKSDSPNPISVNNTTTPPLTTTKTDSLRSPYYILDNDTSLKFIEKYNGKTLRFIDPRPNGYKDTLLVSFNLKIGSYSGNVIRNKIKCLNVIITGIITTFNYEYLFFTDNSFVSDMVFNMNLDNSPWLYVVNNINISTVNNIQNINIKIIKNDSKILILNISVGGRESLNYQALL